MITVNSEPLATRAEAEAWRDRYLNGYHPCGYGTTLQIKERVKLSLPTGETQTEFVVSGWRASSCD